MCAATAAVVAGSVLAKKCASGPEKSCSWAHNNYRGVVGLGSTGPALLLNVYKQCIWLFQQNTPNHGSTPPHIRIARWPKTPVEWGKCIGAERADKSKGCVVVCTAGEQITQDEKMTKV